MSKENIKACMVGESIFKVGDVASLGRGWGRYEDKLSLLECMGLRILELYYVYENDSYLPKFIALVETLTGNTFELDVLDLNDVRNFKENREELNKLGYNFYKGCIYGKGYERLDGSWKFFNVGFDTVEQPKYLEFA